jgi:hypothetical protein
MIGGVAIRKRRYPAMIFQGSARQSLGPIGRRALTFRRYLARYRISRVTGRPAKGLFTPEPLTSGRAVSSKFHQNCKMENTDRLRGHQRCL